MVVKFKLSIPKDVFDAVRELPTRVTRQFNADVQATVLPALQRDVQALITEPGAVKRPFQFGTPKSRRFYFWKFKGQLPYQRTRALVNAWVVDISRQGPTNYLQVYNTSDAAQYVYGSPQQRAVIGHIRTGWPATLPPALALIQEHAIDLIIDSWYRAVEGSLR